MSRVIGGARPWNESEARVGQRHTPRPPTSALIDAPRQSNFSLRASFFAVNIATAATPDSHPDCRALLIQIVALHEPRIEPDSICGVEVEPRKPALSRLIFDGSNQYGACTLSPTLRDNEQACKPWRHIMVRLDL